MKAKILNVGHACLDIVYSVANIPPPNTKVASESIEFRVGGNAANAAVALADMGALPDLCSVIGNEAHPFTRILLSLLRQHNVNTNYCMFDETQMCPSSAIMVLPDGDRSIVNWQGEKIRQSVSLPADILDYQLVMADCYRLPMVNQIFDMARAAHIPTMIDVDGVIEDLDLIPKADYIWFSSEAWRYFGTPIQELQQYFGSFVGITDGRNPVIWCDNTGNTLLWTPPVITAKNTLGAGDVFRARFGLGICNNEHENLNELVHQSCLMASRHITNQDLGKVI